MRVLILLLCCFFSLSSLATVPCSSDNCMIVVDSGSTGSRAHLYKYKFNLKNTPVSIQEIRSNVINPGLASLAKTNNKSQLNKYLTKLFSGLEQSQVIPVYYYSTAGMRLLPVDKQKTIYNLVSNWFKTQNGFNLKGLRTISGHEEGVYAWLGVNYLAGRFIGNSKQNTIGVMDFGGASVQVAAAINDKHNLSQDNVTNITISGKNYNIYAVSYLGLGINELTKQFLNESSCFANGYPLPDGDKSVGDVIECENDVEILTNNLHHVSDVQFNGVASEVKTWVGLGSLYHLHKSKPFNSLTSKVTMKQILSLAQSKACQVDWDSLQKSDPNNEYLFNTCLASAYYYALIVRGYGLNENTVINTEIDGISKDLDWTYGVVIKSHI